MPHPFKIRSIAAVTISLAGLAAGVAGCSHADVSSAHLLRPSDRFAVEWDSTVDRDLPVAFDIRNARGSVRVEVDEKLSAPTIDANASWDVKDWRGQPRAQVHRSAVHATVESGEGPGAIVRIDGRLGDMAPESGYLDLRIRTPRCDGIRIINSGGPIVMVGVGGAITAENGTETGIGGRIELRTSEEIREPVALVTAGGPVSAVLGPGGRGIIEIDAEDGSAQFESIYGTVTEVRPATGRYRAVWNGGTNPIIARSADGDCHIQIKPNAEMYTVSDGWLALFKD